MIAPDGHGSGRALAVQLVASLGNTPAARRLVAALFGVDERTIRRWQARSAAGEPMVRKRGRRPKKVSREARRGVIHDLVRLGPCAGVAVLRGLWRRVPYRQLAALKRRFVRVMQRRRGWYRRKLEWLRPGAVWAMDFTKPKADLPGEHERLFQVRDLGSGFQLAAEPCPGERAGVACFVLLMLFLCFGAPLVIKADNGGAFHAHETQALFDAFGVTCLFSPPYCPQYNGSAERGGGTLKLRIEHLARLAGRPGRWTYGAIARAIGQANTTARPRGATGPTPAEVWVTRRPIPPEERKAFLCSCAGAKREALRTFQSTSGRMPACSELAAIDRHALQHVLLEGGYLQFRRGRLSTPLQTWRADIKA